MTTSLCVLSHAAGQNERFRADLDPNGQDCWSVLQFRLAVVDQQHLVVSWDFCVAFKIKSISARNTLLLEQNSSLPFVIVVVLKECLPNNLPPSYRGSFIRFAYKVLICVEVDENRRQLIHLPFRLLPSLHAYSVGNSSCLPSSISSAASSTIVNARDGAGSEGACWASNMNPFHLSTLGDGDERFNFFDNGGIFSQDELHPMVYDKLSRLFSTNVGLDESKPAEKRRRNRSRKKSTARPPSTLFAELVSSSSVGKFHSIQPAFWDIIHSSCLHFLVALLHNSGLFSILMKTFQNHFDVLSLS